MGESYWRGRINTGAQFNRIWSNPRNSPFTVEAVVVPVTAILLLSLFVFSISLAHSPRLSFSSPSLIDRWCDGSTGIFRRAFHSSILHAFLHCTRWLQHLFILNLFTSKSTYCVKLKLRLNAGWVCAFRYYFFFFCLYLFGPSKIPWCCILVFDLNYNWLTCCNNKQ